MIAIKEEKMDVQSLTQGRSQQHLSALVEVGHEDSSMMQVDFGRLEESIENDTSPLKQAQQEEGTAKSARHTRLMHVNTMSNTGTERTLLSPARAPEDQVVLLEEEMIM